MQCAEPTAGEGVRDSSNYLIPWQCEGKRKRPTLGKVRSFSFHEARLIERYAELGGGLVGGLTLDCWTTYSVLKYRTDLEEGCGMKFFAKSFFA